MVSTRTILFAILLVCVSAKRDPRECEVCISVLTQVMSEMPSADATSQDKVAEKIREVCGGSKNKDNKFCFYIGALPESATSIMNDVAKPLSWQKPPEKVCDQLRTKDQQICELKYDKELDWSTIDLNKMRVKELQKILVDWGEVCKACTEKTEFIKRIEELKPKYVKAQKTDL